MQPMSDAAGRERELLPCPFCGAAVKLTAYTEMDNKPAFNINCDACDQAGTLVHPSAQSCTCAWNARAPSAPGPETLKRLVLEWARRYGDREWAAACARFDAAITDFLQTRDGGLTDVANASPVIASRPTDATQTALCGPSTPSVEVAAAIELTDAQCDAAINDAMRHVSPMMANAGYVWEPDKADRAVARHFYALGAAASRAVGTRTRPDEIAIGALAYWLFVRDGADELTTTWLPYMQEAERALRAVDDAVYDAAEAAPGGRDK